MRMRTIDAAIAQLRHDDPGSCLTRHALRQMVLTGQVPHVRVGNKYLVDYDRFLSFLTSGYIAPIEAEPPIGVIRRIR